LTIRFGITYPNGSSIGKSVNDSLPRSEQTHWIELTTGSTRYQVVRYSNHAFSPISSSRNYTFRGKPFVYWFRPVDDLVAMILMQDQSLVQPCWNVANGEEDGFLQASKCSPFDKNQRFFVKIHPEQIDVKNKKVYFAIHSDKYPDQCLSKRNSMTFEPFKPKFYSSKRCAPTATMARIDQCRADGWDQ